MHRVLCYSQIVQFYLLRPASKQCNEKILVIQAFLLDMPFDYAVSHLNPVCRRCCIFLWEWTKWTIRSGVSDQCKQLCLN